MAHRTGTTTEDDWAGLRPSSLLVTHISVVTVRSAVSLSSYGGEGEPLLSYLSFSFIQASVLFHVSGV
jgi:hypothetical protein